MSINQEITNNTDSLVVESSDSLANNASVTVDSLVNIKPQDLIDIIQRGIDGNTESFINTITKNITDFSINLLISVAIFFFGRWLIKRINYVVGLTVVHRSVDRSVRSFIKGLVSTALYTLLLLIIVQVLGINTTSLVAMLASAGIAIGMALSGTLQNFAGGMIILFLKPYKVGDYITTQDEAGIVKDIMLFNTVLETYNRHTIFIPNGLILNSSIKNDTYAENRRIEWSVAISYGDSVELARSIILDILNSDERILHNEEPSEEDNRDDYTSLNPTVYLSELGDSSVNLVVRAWVETKNYWYVYYEMYEKFYDTLPKRGVTFPFPQMDIHVKGEDGEKTLLRSKH